MKRGVWTAGILGAMVCGLWPGLSSAAPPSAPNPRSLPSLVARWTWPAPDAQWMAIDGTVAYVQTSDHVAALDLATGTALWNQPLGVGPAQEDRYSRARPLPLEHTVVAAAGKTLFVLDRATGRLQRSIALDGQILQTAGPPLIVSVYEDRRNHVDIVAIDADSGEVRARRDAGRSLPFFELRDGALVTRLERTDVDGHDIGACVGLRAGDLSELWRLDPRTCRGFEVLDDGIQVELGPNTYAPLEPTTGRVGAAVSFGDSPSLSFAQRDLTLVDREGEPAVAKLARIDRATGQPVWVAELPCASSPTRFGDVVYTSCGRGGASTGYLIALEWATGKVQRLTAGPAGLRDLTLFQDLLIAHTSDGVVAWSARELGPIEGVVHPVRDEVRRLLRQTVPAVRAYWGPRSVVSDLEALGPEALPVLAEEVPTLDMGPLLTAAAVLGNSGYAPAGPLLARRFPEVARWAQGERANQLVPLVEALGRTGGPAEVPLIAAVLEDPSRPTATRQAAFSALVGIGTPDAQRALDGMLDGTAPARLTWKTPSPPTTLDPHRAVRLTRADGSAVVVFADNHLGGIFDVWAAEVDTQGQARGPSLFLAALGVECHLPAYCVTRTGKGPLRARLEGTVIDIEPAETADAPLRFDLREAARDSDGDGLSDAVEARLGTDPARRDTDGDGLADAEDPSPDSARTPATEEEEITAAVVRQFLAFNPTDHVLGVVSRFALNWTGARGPILTLSEEGRHDGEGAFFNIITVHPAPSDEHAASRPGTLGPDERRYQIGRIGGGYEVVVRRLGSRWYLRSIRMTSIV